MLNSIVVSTLFFSVLGLAGLSLWAAWTRMGRPGSRFFLWGVCLVAIPGVAWAAEAAPSGGFNWYELWVFALSGFGSVVAGLFTWWGKQYLDQILKDAQHKTKLFFLDDLVNFLLSGAAAIYQDTIKELKAHGEWTAETKKAVFDRLKQSAWDNYGYMEIVKHFGSGKAAEEQVAGMAKRAVDLAKIKGKAAKKNPSEA